MSKEETKQDNKQEAKQEEKCDIQQDFKKPLGPDKDDIFDTYLYPERRGVEWKRTWWKSIMGLQGRESTGRFVCEKKVYECLQTPSIKLLLGALENAGCNFDISRHVVCEICDSRLSGGYDPELNQIVVCQNTAGSKGRVLNTLAHELIHMLDNCENNFDFKNIDHVACSEVRAANLTNCSYFGSLIQGFHPFFQIKQAHQACVKERATMSLLAIKKITRPEAEAAVDRVFTKCYNDLEPIGRRVKRRSGDFMRAYKEGHYYGYI